jgi:hypothetical protein
MDTNPHQRWSGHIEEIGVVCLHLRTTTLHFHTPPLSNLPQRLPNSKPILHVKLLCSKSNNPRHTKRSPPLPNHFRPFDDNFDPPKDFDKIQLFSSKAGKTWTKIIQVSDNNWNTMKNYYPKNCNISQAMLG